MTRHLKTCKFKKTNSDISKELEIILEKVKELENENEILKETVNKNEKIIDSVVKKSTKKILGNTLVETVRSQARKKYKKLFINMKCVHCKHNGSTQVSHKSYFIIIDLICYFLLSFAKLRLALLSSSVFINYIINDFLRSLLFK